YPRARFARRDSRSAGLSVDGGLPELDEFWPTRARSSATSARSRSFSASSALTTVLRSATSRSSSAIRRSRSSCTPMVDHIRISLSIPHVASDRYDPGITASSTGRGKHRPVNGYAERGPHRSLYGKRDSTQRREPRDVKVSRRLRKATSL